MAQRELSYQSCKELETHVRDRNKNCLYPLSANDVYVHHGSAYTSYICYLQNCGNSFEERKPYIYALICTARNHRRIYTSKYYSLSVMTGCSNETTWLPSCILK